MATYLPTTTSDLTAALPAYVTNPLTLARSLGWLSLGLGLSELLAGANLNRGLGVRGWAGLTRFFGLREIGAGVGLVAARRLGPWMWARVAGDALDLAALTAALVATDKRRPRLGGALAVVAAITALDVVCAVQLHRRGL